MFENKKKKGLLGNTKKSMCNTMNVFDGEEASSLGFFAVNIHGQAVYTSQLQVDGRIWVQDYIQVYDKLGISLITKS